MTKIQWRVEPDYDFAQYEKNTVHERYTDILEDRIQIGYNPSVLGPDMIGYWPCDEDGGSLSNYAPWKDADAKGEADAMQFIDGTPTFNGEEIIGTSSTIFNGGENANTGLYYDETAVLPEFTIAAWVKLNSTSDQCVSSADRSEYYRFDVVDTNSSHTGIGFSTTDETGSTHDMSGSTTLNTGEWYLIGARYDSSSGEKAILLNGEVDATSSPHGNYALGTGVKRWLSFGSTQEGTGFRSSVAGQGNKLQSNIAHFMIWERAISNEEWANLYNIWQTGEFVSKRKGETPYVPLTRPSATGGMATAVSVKNITNTSTWETASDWDNAVDEAGVVHEDFGRHAAKRIEMGYPSFDRGGTNLEAYWPLDEFSGASTAHDVSGNNRDGTNNGPTTGEPGILGTAAYYFNRSEGDYVQTNWSGITGTTARTWNFWFKSSDDTIDQRMISYGANNSGEKYDIRCDNGNGNVLRVENSGGQAYGSTKIADGSWHMCTVVFPSGGSDVQDHRLYVDGSQESIGGGSQSLNTASSTDVRIGQSHFHGDTVEGKLEAIRAYNRELSGSEIQALYDAAQQSYLETATKEFANPSQPDLTDLDYTLNGQTIDLKIIGSPGTTDEEVVTQTLDGGTEYTLSWSNSHTKFRLRPVLSTADVTAAPEFNSGTLY